MRFAWAVVIAFLLWPAGRTGELNAVDGQQRGKTIETVLPASLKLTSTQPSGSFVIAPATIAAAPPVLSVFIIQVVNPEKTPVEVFAYLVRSDERQATTARILVGQFGLFPPDHPAGFTLRSSGAFQKLRESGSNSNSTKILLLFELKPISGKRSLANVELTVAPPEWRTE